MTSSDSSSSGFIQSGIQTRRGQVYVGISCVFTAIAILFVSLRIWAKNISRRSFEPHDHLIIGSLVSPVRRMLLHQCSPNLEMFTLGFLTDTLIGWFPEMLQFNPCFHSDQ
jgi:hypothetical protein